MTQYIRHTPELSRVLALPRRRADDFSPLLVDELTEVLRTARGSMRLRAAQALLLHDIGTYGGGFCMADVGQGKTIPSLLAPYVLNAERPLLVLRASLIDKTKRDIKELREHWRIPNNIYLYSYEMLGRVQAYHELEVYKPDLIIADETQWLKNRRAAVTRRVARYMHEHPETKFVALSGTVMKKSIVDFAHILRWCLKDNAPVPKTVEETEEWSLAIDEKVADESRFHPGALLKLCEKVDESDVIGSARRGFQQRLLETPGVVSVIGEGEKVASKVTIRALTYEVADVTEHNFRKLRGDPDNRKDFPGWLTPDDWPLSQPVDVWRHSKELALGFHYAWVEQEVWKKWLAPILRSAENKTSDTVQQIVNVLRPMKENARNGLSDVQKREIGSSNIGMALKLATSKDWNEIRKESAPSATACPGGKPNTGASASIMITQRDKSADFSASPAIGPSEFSATQSTEFRELLHTCLALAKPPQNWRNARSDWAAFVRDVLSRSRTLDSELQVAHACDAGKLDATALNRWRAIRDTFKPNTVAVWCDDSAIKVCLDWMKRPGVVWTEHDLFARRLAQLSGCPYYGAKGFTDRKEFINDADPKRSAIVSFDANREGRNLQAIWNRCLFTSLTEGADALHQAIGRFHRTGQTKDVEVDILLGCIEHANAWRKALSAAQAIKDTTGGASKLLLAKVQWPSDDEIASFSGWRWGNASYKAEGRLAS